MSIARDTCERFVVPRMPRNTVTTLSVTSIRRRRKLTNRRRTNRRASNSAYLSREFQGEFNDVTKEKEYNEQKRFMPNILFLL